MTRRLVITHKSHEVWVLNRRRIRKLDHCDRCLCSVRWLTPKEAMAITDLTEREVFKLVEGELVHSVETEDGFLQICSASVATLKSTPFDAETTQRSNENEQER